MSRRRYAHILTGAVIALMLAAPGCGPDAGPDTPQLIAHMTLTPTTALPSVTPTRTEARVTPTTTVTASPTRTPHAPAGSPLARTVTPRATPPRWLYSPTPIVITATLRPSRTPTASPMPTHTATATLTATPSPTRTPTVTPTLPGGGYTIPSIAPSLPAATPCAIRWFFTPEPATCPVSAPVSQAAAYQPFERGAMIWLSAERNILVLFNSPEWPSWMLVPDNFQDGMPDADPAILPPDGLIQPVRGFGLAWRTDPALHTRLGWALVRETGYTTLIQSDAHTGTRYVQGPDTRVYVLPSDHSSWDTVR